MTIKDKTVLVTGSNRGIGQALVEEGAGLLAGVGVEVEAEAVEGEDGLEVG